MDNFNFTDEAGFEKRRDELVEIIEKNGLRRACFVWEETIVEVTKLKEGEYSIDPGPESAMDIQEFLGKKQCENCKLWVTQVEEVELPRFKGDPARTVNVCNDCESSHYHAMQRFGR
jgi:hypothetical protein